MKKISLTLSLTIIALMFLISSVSANNIDTPVTEDTGVVTETPAITEPEVVVEPVEPVVAPAATEPSGRKINLLSAIAGQAKDAQDKKLSVIKGNVDVDNIAEFTVLTDGFTQGSLKARLVTESVLTLDVLDSEGNILGTQEVTPKSDKVVSVDFTVSDVSEVSIKISGEGSYILLPTSSLE